MKRAVKQNAFSLLEILVALLIFSVVGLATQGLVSSSIKSQESILTRTQQLETIAEVALRMRSDFLQIMNRSVVLDDTTKEASFVGGKRTVTFTKAGWANPLESKRSNYQRVTYVISQSGLEREHSQWLDISDEKDSARRKFTQIEEVSFQYLNTEMEWVSVWDSEIMGYLPRAIQVFFSTEGFVEVVRVFEIPSFEDIEIAANALEGNDDGTEDDEDDTEDDEDETENDKKDETDSIFKI